MVIFLQICQLVYLGMMIAAFFSRKDQPSPFFVKHRKLTFVLGGMAIIGCLYTIYRLITGQIF